MKIVLKAKSSNKGESYNVEFLLSDDKLSVFCDCPAGRWGKFCKHKWQLLHGDVKMLFDEAQIEELKTIERLAQERNIDGLYETIAELENANKRLSKTQKKEKAIVNKCLDKRDALTKENFESVRAELVKIEQEIEFNKYLIAVEKKNVENHFNNGF